MFFDSNPSGSFNVSPYILLNLRTISRHCSINGSWSSPTGITSPSNAVISAACDTGYPKKPYVIDSPSLPNISFFWATSVFTVGFLCNLATVT